MTFKDLKKRIGLGTATNQQQQQQHRLFVKLKDKPFWIWDTEQHKQEDARTKG